MADPKKPGPDLSERKSVLGMIDAGMRAAANFVTFGYADKLDAMMSSGSFKDNMERNQAINEFDEKENTAAVRTGQVGITVVAAAPGLVKAAIGKTVQVGSNLLARATGRAATAEVVVAQTAARVVPAAVAAPSAATATATAAKATTLAGKAGQLAGKAAKNTAKAGVAMGVPLVVADTLVAAAMESEATEKPATAEEIAGVNSSTIQGGASAVASAITLAAVAPGAMAFAERMGERMAERMGGRFKSIVQLGEKLASHLPESVKHAAENGVAHVADLAKSGATTMAKAFGVAYVAGEVVAGQYVADSNSNTPSTLVQAVDVVRDTYADIKKAGLSRNLDGTISGVAVALATVLVTELTEGLIPGIGNISEKEAQLLRAKDADFGNPHMIRLMQSHMGSELDAIKRDMEMRKTAVTEQFEPLIRAPGMPTSPEAWKAQVATMSQAELEAHPLYQYENALRGLAKTQNLAMQGFDDRWRPAQENLDRYLAGGKADLANPAIAALAAARMEDGVAAVQRKFEIGLTKDGTFDYRTGQWMFNDPSKFDAIESERAAAMAALESKWKPVDERMAALARPQGAAVTAAAPAAAQPEATVHAAAPAAEAPAKPTPPQATRPVAARPPVRTAPAAAVVAAAPTELAGPPAPDALGADAPHETFNVQAALPDPDPAIAAAYAAAQGAAVQVGGLAPSTVTLPPLVGATGAGLGGEAGATVDLSVLHSGVEPSALPEPEIERARPIALNTRTPNMTGNFG